MVADHKGKVAMQLSIPLAASKSTKQWSYLEIKMATRGRRLLNAMLQLIPNLCAVGPNAASNSSNFTGILAGPTPIAPGKTAPRPPGAVQNGECFRRADQMKSAIVASGPDTAPTTQLFLKMTSLGGAYCTTTTCTAN
jgi:hypothetical protein